PPEVDLPSPRDAVDGAVDLDAGDALDAMPPGLPDDLSAPDVMDDPTAEVDDADADEHRPGQIVRRKVHTAHPMSVDDALSRMELVGHDFYLFADAESGAPSVVYRRKGYDYGVIRLAR
ncbi:MAG: hypothetical protein QOK35_1995, partial [Pseudonocardiales bacterium]|nr:hypothetical protein [Pseudonocardiales bacterium]